MFSILTCTTSAIAQNAYMKQMARLNQIENARRNFRNHYGREPDVGVSVLLDLYCAPWRRSPIPVVRRVQ